MNKHTNICIQGDGTPEYGKTIIDYLESLGGKLTWNIKGYHDLPDHHQYYYYILKSGVIDFGYDRPVKRELINLKDMDQIKQPTKEQILEAANKCPQAKQTLKTLFPEVFDDYKYLSKDELICKSGFINRNMIDIRISDKFKNKGYYLSDSYNWEIITDDNGVLCLIPTKR